MATIEKKILPAYFELVASGKKKFELRLNEFKISEGDTLRLREYDPERHAYTGRVVEKIVTYVGTFKLDGLFWSEKEIKERGLHIISLK